MPRLTKMDSKAYWDSYGTLNPKGYVPIMSQVGLARAVGVPASDRVLRVYCYLASRSVSGYWLVGRGETEQYEALCQFIATGMTDVERAAEGYDEWDGALVERDGLLCYHAMRYPGTVEVPKSLERELADANNLARITANVSVSSATHRQMAAMFPTHTEASAIKAAGDAVKELEAAEVVRRVYRGVPGRTASLYVWLPIVYDITNKAGERSTFHYWRPDMFLWTGDDFGDSIGEPRCEWPWPL